MKAGIVRLFWVIYFICVIPALFTIGKRADFDTGFNKVALVADYYQLMELAQTENTDISDVLTQVRDSSGINHIALLEDTPQFLALRGECTIIEGIGWPEWLTLEERDEIERNRGREPVEARPPDNHWPLLLDLSHDKTHLVFEDEDVYQRVLATAFRRYGNLASGSVTDDGRGVLSLSGEPKITLEWGLGFDPDLVAELKSSGFEIYPRLKNYPGYSIETVESIISETGEIFPGMFVIFDGDSITGGRALATDVAGYMQAADLNVGWVEFAEQNGADLLSDAYPGGTARVHSIEDEEMEIITVDRAVDRYLRSIKERACRIVYLKPFLLQSDSQNRLDKTVGLFGAVRGAVEEHGYETGEPSVISEPYSPGYLTWNAIAIALAAAIILLLMTLGFRIPVWLIVVTFVVAIAIRIVGGDAGQKIITLAMAIISPTLAISWIAGKYDSAWPEIRKLRITQIWPTLLFWLGVYAITLNGAILIGASMISEKTMLQIDAFSGVKVALYLPILFAILIGTRLIVPQENRTLAGGLKWLINYQLKIWHVLVGIVGLLVLFIMLDRSGNFPLLPVANWENDIRGWLENALYARPRTKEFLIGHPALIIGFYYGFGMIRIRRPFMYGGIIVGSIALTSITNTFCHIHTPVMLSIYRTFAAAVLGLVIGIIISVLIMIVMKIFKVAPQKLTA